MIELAIATRFLVDFFWAEKVLSLLHTIAFAYILLLMALQRRGRPSKVSAADFSVGLLAVFIVQSFLREATADTAIELSKFLAYCLFYVFGRIVPSNGQYMRWLSHLSFAAICALAASAFIGWGYVQWGSVNTFAGGYFFKTDAALACLVFLTMVNVEFRSRLILAAALVMAAYVVFSTNARIALPLVLAVPICCRYLTGASRRGKRMGRLFVIIGISLGSGALIAAALTVIAPDLLGFDIANPFSEGNTQGRSVIWAALMQAFLDSSTTTQLFGAGLSADQSATAIFSATERLASTRAHNSFLYLLLSIGVLGSVAFLWVLFQVLGAVRSGARSPGLVERKWVAMLASLALIFFVISLTAEAVIRPQIMIPLFLVFGVVVREQCVAFARTQASARTTGRYA